MRGAFGPPCRPPWWPENEPWPPHGSAAHWQARRARFFRRAALFVLIVFIATVAGSFLLARLAFTTAGAVVPAAWAAVALAVFPAVLILAGRRLATTMGRVMEAADRVAAGNYTVRVPEQGPPTVRAMARSFNTMTERLQNHDRVRRDLMADVAHELRTPLTVIQGKLEGLIDGVYPRDEPHLQELLDETHVLSRLVEDLRTLALSDSGALKLQKEPADLADLARDVVNAFAAEAAARQVTLAIDAPADCPAAEIDPVRIREVFSNLLSNALRHTPSHGSVHVRVEAADGVVAVDVTDSGKGMTAEEIARAFDRFYKGSESRGSGLGLTIAKSLVAAHGGEIHASSEPGRGTTMRFTLPWIPPGKTSATRFAR
jgi:signal transduction histidine kinase